MPEQHDDRGVEVTEGITPEGDGILFIRIKTGGDIHQASLLTEQVRAIVITVWEAAQSPLEEIPYVEPPEHHRKPYQPDEGYDEDA